MVFSFMILANKIKNFPNNDPQGRFTMPLNKDQQKNLQQIFSFSDFIY